MPVIPSVIMVQAPRIVFDDKACYLRNTRAGNLILTK